MLFFYETIREYFKEDILDASTLLFMNMVLALSTSLRKCALKFSNAYICGCSLYISKRKAFDIEFLQSLLTTPLDAIVRRTQKRKCLPISPLPSLQ